MRTTLLRAAAVAGVLWLTTGPAVAQHRIVLDGSGRTITSDTQFSPSRDIQIDVPAAPVNVCGKAFAPLGTEVRYVVQADIGQPRVLRAGEGTPATAKGTVFTIAATKKTSFVIYNVVTTFDTGDADLKTCGQRVAVEEGREEEWKQDVEDLEADVADAGASLARLRERLKSEQQDVAAFTGMEGAGPQLAAAIASTSATRALVAAADQALAAKQAELDDARSTLAGFGARAQAALGAELGWARYLVGGLNNGLVTKVGAIAVGGRRKIVLYDFASVSSRSTLQLMPLANYPIVRYGDEVVAVIANVNRQAHPYPFQLSLTVTAGAPIDIEPVRPTFDAAGEGDRGVAARPPASARAYVDVVLPLRGTFAPNAIPEVTILTERPSDADPKKPASATLVDKARYPQFRALYRYNFNTGIARSTLQRAEFSKVRIADDDPATEQVNESRYRILESRADPRIMPVAAFTYYLKPVDIQAPAGWERLIPNPTIGFAVANPADNVFLGWSHEVLRNTQVFWGWHWGTQKELVARNDISEDHDATAPVTRDRFARAFSVGVTFNVASVARLFK